ncbi:uncharacterized protein MEPE_06512 [Melanopsichium pennsylvanicum]|uniref:Uncharacterized protein n=1 Tax=Melanopsichium pennsylvanicum TaxID=63383 RepID=A0AAJ4XTN5_9BASI|nr:uncharacterized protein MEPE_06512 [Melanopsichium pennsylvanicum]
MLDLVEFEDSLVRCNREFASKSAVISKPNSCLLRGYYEAVPCTMNCCMIHIKCKVASFVVFRLRKIYEVMVDDGQLASWQCMLAKFRVQLEAVSQISPRFCVSYKWATLLAKRAEHTHVQDARTHEHLHQVSVRQPLLPLDFPELCELHSRPSTHV